MALIQETDNTLDANGRIVYAAKNQRTGQTNRYTFAAFGDFGGGTIAVQMSPDGGTTWIDNIQLGAPFTFTENTSDNFEANSDEKNPVLIGFNLTGATSPAVTVKLYNNG